MSEPRLKSNILIQAGVRLCSERAVPAMVVRRGDPDAGAVYIKINGFENGCAVLSQVRMEDGRLAWFRATGTESVSEADADAYIERQAKYDPDIWVLEVEDRDQRNPFDDPMM
jgi:GMP synthase (glutamine-hydrolysing)